MQEKNTCKELDRKEKVTHICKKKVSNKRKNNRALTENPLRLLPLPHAMHNAAVKMPSYMDVVLGGKASRSENWWCCIDKPH